jgi:hypothetical protein
MLVCHGLTNSMEKILEQSVVTQFVTNFPAFYGTRRFIAIYTSHTLVPVQSQMSSIHTPPCMPLNSILILYYHLHTGPPSGLFVSGFPTKFSHLFLISTMRATCPVNLILRGPVQHFATSWFLSVKTCQLPAQPPNWGTTPCRLYANVYSIYSKIPSISGCRLLYPLVMAGTHLTWLLF